MNETIYVIFKVQFDFALEEWFSIAYHYVQFSWRRSMASRHEVYAGHALRSVSLNKTICFCQVDIKKFYFCFGCHGNQHNDGNSNL